MPAQVVVGAQWGDEGKGKIVHALSGHHEYIVRFNGGSNAGHTLVTDEGKQVIHLLPVGIIERFKKNVIGPQMVCCLEKLVDELKIADANKSEVFLDRRASIVLPIHKMLDGAREGSSGDQAIGTTKRGIGPCYEDYASRRGLRLGDLESKDKIVAELKRGRYYEEKLALAYFYDLSDVPKFDEVVEWVAQFSKRLTPHLTDTIALAHEALRLKKPVLFEGAQGVNLDIVHGSRPYQTSSSCGAGAVTTSFGLFNFERVIGVAKAYATRVGGGELPSEMSDEDADRLRNAGGEFGATTGRNRRCGWLNLPLLRESCDVGGVTHLVINKVDVLGTTFDHFRVYVRDDKYAMLPGWSKDDRIKDIRVRENLPHGARMLFDLIEKHTDRPVIGIGTGPRREDILWKRD